MNDGNGYPFVDKGRMVVGKSTKDSSEQRDPSGWLFGNLRMAAAARDMPKKILHNEAYGTNFSMLLEIEF